MKRIYFYMKRYSYTMDMTKAALALVVIAIHINPFGENGGGSIRWRE